eukprot:TRINITY_DN349_c1_g1_i2.p1 TRINITY_DN349_c1_g1~~TRINITY_DN349_c1_g1_i2.p1  ORF type:complete len:120 (+),score=0.02 TRINITY_DN349_c1_g1_i2:319-678(+)
MVPVDSVRVPRDPTYSGTPREATPLSFTGLSPSMVRLSKRFNQQMALQLSCERPYNPAEETSTVWAISRSLAATEEIDFSFFSCGYLDVSVHRVRLGIPGSMLVCQLPQAFRRLPRPCS